MSGAAAKGAHPFGLRDQREPGHCWMDNEIFDVFGDLIGPNGILLYATMSRLCWGHEVKLSLDKIAGHSRQSRSTVHRTMRLLVKVGLVEEARGEKLKTALVYKLVNAKRLAAHYVAERLRGSLPPQTVPVGDSAATRPETPKPNPCNEKSSIAMPTLVRLLYPTTGQIAEQIAEPSEAEDKNFSAQAFGTDLSHPETNLSQIAGRNKEQDTRLQDQVLPPTPVGGGALAEPSPAKPSLDDAVRDQTRRVMRARAFSDPRLAPVIRAAMWQAMEAGGKTPVEVADRMIANHAQYVSSGAMLKFTWGPRKFFAEGHWLNWQGWPIDQKLLSESRRL